MDVTLVSGQELTLVNNGGGGYTDGTTTNSTAFTEVVNEQTGQGSQTLPNLGTLTITFVVERGQVTSCIVGNNVGSNAQSGDTFTIDGGDANNLARVMILKVNTMATVRAYSVQSDVINGAAVRQQTVYSYQLDKISRMVRLSFDAATPKMQCARVFPLPIATVVQLLPMLMLSDMLTLTDSLRL